MALSTPSAASEGASSQQNQKKYKLVFLGEPSASGKKATATFRTSIVAAKLTLLLRLVGKTSLITRFMYDSFDNIYQATIGIDFLSKAVQTDNGQTIRLQLWDTAGQERYRSLIPSYIRDSSMAVIVFDITNRDSFLKLDSWIENVRLERDGRVKLYLVGNKIDLEADEKNGRAVTWEEAHKKASECSAKYIETSAFKNVNVSQLFKMISADLVGDADARSDAPVNELVDVSLSANAGAQTNTLFGVSKRGCCSIN